MDNKQVHRLPKDIEHYFGFLRDRGFSLRDVEHAEWLGDNWTVIFESRVMLVYVSNNDSRITLELSGNKPTVSNRRIPIERLISTLSDGQDIVTPFRDSMVGGKKKQLERLANLLRQRIDQLISYFENLS